MIEPRAAVFFDRDGVLNVDRGYVSRVEDFTWVEGAVDALALLNRLGYLTVVVTNQSGVARGMYTENDVNLLHAWMSAELTKSSTHVDAFYYCPHHPEAVVARYRKSCACRKPGPAMLVSAMRDLSIDAARSLLIGDKPSDLAAARAAGVRGLLFSGGNLCSFVESALSADSL